MQIGNKHALVNPTQIRTRPKIQAQLFCGRKIPNKNGAQKIKPMVMKTTLIVRASAAFISRSEGSAKRKTIPVTTRARYVNAMSTQ
jgi:hypothetical protein